MIRRISRGRRGNHMKRVKRVDEEVTGLSDLGFGLALGGIVSVVVLEVSGEWNRLEQNVACVNRSR
jgi:hypothetical protein